MGIYEFTDKAYQYWWIGKNSFDWNSSNEAWVRATRDLPKFENLIQLTDTKNETWLVIEGYPSWEEPVKIGEEKWNYPHKELWGHIRSYIVKDCEFNKLKDWIEKQDFMGRWMPESSDRYEIFNREYYWSPAYRYFQTEYYKGEEWRLIQDRDTGEFIANVIVPVERFVWEEEFDKSKEETISFLKPCINIYKKMGLKYSHVEGEFLSSNNEVICFATNVYNNSKSYLLIKKTQLFKYLDDNNLKLFGLY